MFLVARRQTDARIVGKAGRAVADVGDGRERPRDLRIGIAHALGKPWAARVGRVDELPADAPSAVAALDRVNPARRIAAVGIVFAGPKIAILIERKLLRIAQAEMNDLEF
jgi:hypothetical protein